MQLNHSTPPFDSNATIAMSGPADSSPHHCFAGEPRRPSPMLVSSIAATAGLSRFVYLIGKSDYRYVFSAISKAQMSLYCGAVFAIVEDAGERLWVGDYSQLIKFLNSDARHQPPHIFVHLLADGTAAKSHIIADLTRTNTN